MYFEHFNLKAFPFENASDPAFFVAQGQYRNALAALLYGVVSGKGLMVVVGPSGCGKTTLSYALRDRLSDEFNLCSIVYLGSRSLEITQFLAGELGVSVLDGPFLLLAKSIKEKLLEEREKGRKSVLVIDEAQLMSAEAFREILFLSNQETSRHKLLQIILMGRPELMRRIKAPQFEPLGQRVAVVQSLEPLDWMQMVKYIQERLKTAGRNAPLFTSQAFSAVHAISRGTPRIINKICDLALLKAFLAEAPIVKAEHILQAARELDVDIPATVLRSSRRRPERIRNTPEVPNKEGAFEINNEAVEKIDSPASPPEQSGSSPVGPVLTPEPAFMADTHKATPPKMDSPPTMDQEHTVHTGGAAAITMLPRRLPGVYQVGFAAVVLCTVIMGWGLLRVVSPPSGFQSASQPAIAEAISTQPRNPSPIDTDALRTSDTHHAAEMGDGEPLSSGVRQTGEKADARQMNLSSSLPRSSTATPTGEPAAQDVAALVETEQPAQPAPAEQSQDQVKAVDSTMDASQALEMSGEAAGNTTQATDYQATSSPSVSNPSPFTLQVATFFDVKKVATAMDNLSIKGLSPYSTPIKARGKRVMYPIYSGYFHSKEEALAYAKKFGLDGVIVQHTPYANLVAMHGEETKLQATLSRLFDLEYYPYVMKQENDKQLLLVGAHPTRHEAEELSLELRRKGIENSVIER